MESDSGDAHQVVALSSLRNRLNDLRFQDVPRCDPMFVGIRRRFQAHLTSACAFIRMRPIKAHQIGNVGQTSVRQFELWREYNGGVRVCD